METKALAARQQKWLIGTVRRMKWVVSQKKDLERKAKKREAYVSKVEAKLLQQAVILRSLQQQHRKLLRTKHSGKRTNRKEHARAAKPAGNDENRMVSNLIGATRRGRINNLLDEIDSPRRAGKNKSYINSSLQSVMQNIGTGVNEPETSPVKSPVREAISEVQEVVDTSEHVKSLDFEGQSFSAEEVEEFADEVAERLQDEYISVYGEENGESEGPSEVISEEERK